jgi:hypothetical protein
MLNYSRNATAQQKINIARYLKNNREYSTKDANKLFDQNIIPEQVHKVVPKTTTS